MFFIGLTGFLLLFLGDINDRYFKIRQLSFLFFAGALLIIGATAVLCFTSEAALPPASRAVFIVLSVVFAALTLYSVFSVVFKARTNPETGGRIACTEGMYSLCRHPGALWFIPLYICLWPAFGFPILYSAIFSAVNILLILFEDILIFPFVLEGYGEYKARTPLLIPRPDILRSWVRRYLKSFNKL